MTDFKRYRRSQVAELADWEPGLDMTDVSVSAEDAKAGSPKSGDKIARNPANHEDKWLVAAAYFVANFEPEAPTAAYPSVAGCCPACHASGSLFLGAGGYVTCSILECRQPDAASELLLHVNDEAIIGFSASDIAKANMAREAPGKSNSEPRA